MEKLSLISGQRVQSTRWISIRRSNYLRKTRMEETKRVWVGPVLEKEVRVRIWGQSSRMSWKRLFRHMSFKRAQSHQGSASRESNQQQAQVLRKSTTTSKIQLLKEDWITTCHSKSRVLSIKWEVMMLLVRRWDCRNSPSKTLSESRSWSSRVQSSPRASSLSRTYL